MGVFQIMQNGSKKQSGFIHSIFIKKLTCFMQCALCYRYIDKEGLCPHGTSISVAETNNHIHKVSKMITECNEGNKWDALMENKQRQQNLVQLV